MHGAWRLAPLHMLGTDRSENTASIVAFAKLALTIRLAGS
jgi:hypothetical protein